MNYEAIIGLEVHVELKTKSKMFCRCLADYFGKEPNTHTCPVCLGFPGALPVPNKQAIDWCIMIGLALNCEIPLSAKFDRKNYFYPDLAKGYQISQYDQPFAINGHVILGTQSEARRTPESPASARDAGQASMTTKRIRIRRVHMEEDTAKLTHQLGVQNDEGYSLIDFNRSGVPLVEIVTEPDFESADEVVQYLKKLQQIVRYLGVSNADMEKGQMRLEPNISLRVCHPEPRFNRGERSSKDSSFRQRLTQNDIPKYKVEVKNINSFRFVEKAIHFEIERQREILENGQTPVQETRGWDDNKQTTVYQRTKEEAHDYRYFPEPDIPPLRFSEADISKLKQQVPELQGRKAERFMNTYGISSYDAEVLTRDKELADYFEEALRVTREISRPKDDSSMNGQISNKTIANYIINKKIDIDKITPAELIQQIISSSQTTPIDQNQLEKVITVVISENQKAVEDYKKGKETVIMFLVGQVMRKFPGKIDAQLVRETIQKKLKNE